MMLRCEINEVLLDVPIILSLILTGFTIQIKIEIERIPLKIPGNKIHHKNVKPLKALIFEKINII
jgi:hypothetical protein